MTIRPVGRIERPKIQTPDRVNHKPRQMIPRNPIPDIRRQQKPLLTTALKRECPRNCVGMSEQEPHVFKNNEEVSRSSEGL